MSPRRRAEARAQPGPSALPLTRWRSGLSPVHRTASFPIHYVKQPSFFSPGSFCVRVLLLPLSTFVAAYPRGDWRSAERRHSLVRVAQVTRDATLARRGPSRAKREARLTALRRGVVGPGPASRAGHDSRADVRDPGRPGVVA